MISAYLRRHPLLRDALLWAIPALIVGLIFRLLILHYSPYAYYGSDSRSFLGFADGVLDKFYFSLNEKRRYLYPIFLLPVSMLPGGTLAWLGWIQAALGLATIIPFAYTIRRIFMGWRWIIIPATLLYACMPVLLWYEHELIAETIFFNCIVWCMAGWAAWVSQKNKARARLLWWTFLVPLAILMLTKPSGKFLWPGIVLGLVVAFSWTILRWPHWLSIALLFLASLTVGDDDQSAWLLYTTVFPLTVLDSPLHAEYKAEIRPMVEEKRQNLRNYDELDDPVHDFLRSPEDHPQYPSWKALAKDDRALEKLYKDLAKEAILNHPIEFLKIGLHRLLGSTNPSAFKPERFEATYFSDRFEKSYRSGKNSETMIRIAFGLPAGQPLPDFEELRSRISPRPDSAAARFLLDYSRAYHRTGQLVTEPDLQRTALADFRPTPLGVALCLGILLSLIPPYLRPLGSWTLVFGIYLVAVYLVGIEHHRYFALAWPWVLLMLALVPETAIRMLRYVTSRSNATPA